MDIDAPSGGLDPARRLDTTGGDRGPRDAGPHPGAWSGWVITTSSRNWVAVAWASCTRPSASRSRSAWRSR